MHKQSELFYCPVPSCSRSLSSSNNNPFSRKDNLQDHLARLHKGVFPQHPIIPQGGCNSPPDQDISSPGLIRETSPVEQINVTALDTRKRRRVRERTASSENADTANEEVHGLREENRKLKRKIEDFEHALELSNKRVEKLVDMIGK